MVQILETFGLIFSDFLLVTLLWTIRSIKENNWIHQEEMAAKSHIKTESTKQKVFKQKAPKPLQDPLRNIMNDSVN
jgi:hypothetical protein